MTELTWCTACGAEPRCEFGACSDPDCLARACESHDLCGPLLPDCWCGASDGMRDECVCWDDGEGAGCSCDSCRDAFLALLRERLGPPWITLTPSARYL